ncbi:hypothetical protein [Sulfuricurvum sp.]|uniref:hypothetical protein n=1 Tax=Sulfuricurvum sp. TaxID=2025608 RepID=UPI003BB5084A
MKCHIPDCPDTVYENDLCIFHCPKDDWFDIVDGKKDWSKSQDKVDQFWKLLHLKFSVGDYAYAGYIFPKFNTDCFLSSENLKDFTSPVSLNRAIFLDDALFNACHFKEIVFFDLAKFIGGFNLDSGSFNRVEAGYLLLNGSFNIKNMIFEEKASFNVFISNKIKIDMIGIKILKDFTFSIFDSPMQEIFDHTSQ